MLEGTDACKRAELGTFNQMLSIEMGAALVDDAASTGTLDAPGSENVLLLLSTPNVEERVGKTIWEKLKGEYVSITSKILQYVVRTMMVQL